MATENIASFTKSIETDCMNQWRKVATKAPAAGLIWQAEVRKVTPFRTGTLRRGQFVEVQLLGQAGIQFSFKTSVPYWWCVNYGGPCSRGQSRMPTHFFELGTQKAIPLMLALMTGKGGGASQAKASPMADWFSRMESISGG